MLSKYSTYVQYKSPKVGFLNSILDRKKQWRYCQGNGDNSWCVNILRVRITLREHWIPWPFQATLHKDPTGRRISENMKKIFFFVRTHPIQKCVNQLLFIRTFCLLWKDFFFSSTLINWTIRIVKLTFSFYNCCCYKSNDENIRYLNPWPDLQKCFRWPRKVNKSTKLLLLYFLLEYVIDMFGNLVRFLYMSSLPAICIRMQTRTIAEDWRQKPPWTRSPPAGHRYEPDKERIDQWPCPNIWKT